MSDSSSYKTTSAQTQRNWRVAPSSTGGWWAIALAVIGLAAWVVLPMMTVGFRETYPVTDTWVMPVIGLVLSGVAAVVNALCIWHWRERSLLNIVAAAIIIPVALFATYMVVGEALAGV